MAKKKKRKLFGGALIPRVPVVLEPGKPPTVVTPDPFADVPIADVFGPSPHPPPPGAAAIAAEREKPLLAALRELRLAGIPTARRKAFTPFAQRGFGASGLAKRGVREALAAREARFARERERIRADVLARAVQETLAAEEIRALRGA